MALDTEAKRWSMLGLANGPSTYSHVINPTGSDFDSQVERLTLLKVYGGDLAADTTAPVLSLPTGTATGSTTASGSVSTDEGNGTLYYYASTNSSESAATIKASGSSQSVTSTGVQNVSVTGLTAETEYYLHYVHDDAASNESNVQSSTAFTTDDAGTGGAVFDFKAARDDEIARLRKLRDEKDLIAILKAVADHDIL